MIPLVHSPSQDLPYLRLSIVYNLQLEGTKVYPPGGIAYTHQNIK